MSDIETVVLDGGELKVEGMNGQNTIIVNRGTSALYASIYPGIVPDGDNVAAIQPGGAMNLLGTNGTLYLLGTGKAQLSGTDISWLPMSLGGSSGGGGSTGGVSQGYVDGQDALTLNAAKKYTDGEIDEVRNEIPAIPESLPADGGTAETLKTYAIRRNENWTGKKWYKFAESHYKTPSLIASVVKIATLDTNTYDVSNYTSDNAYGILDIIFRGTGNANECSVNLMWEYVSGSVNPEDFVIAYYLDEEQIYHVACYAVLGAWNGVRLSTISVVDDGNNNICLCDDSVGVTEIPPEYTTIIPSTIMSLLNTKELQNELADLKAYIGYTDNDIYGLEADFENNKFTRLAGAVGKTPGADFDSVNAFGGRRRCTLKNDGTVEKYYGDAGFDEDGWKNGDAYAIQAMVEQPKFYYKVVPLKTEKIDGADGYHLRKARYYISDTPKPGFKVHPAFIQNGVEVDKIYLSTYEGCICSGGASVNVYLLNDEQTANFNTDALSSIVNAKPASGTTQALTGANARKLAQNRGAGWGITTIQTISATQLLFAIEYATFNSQVAIGNGVSTVTTDTSNQCINTGSTTSLGNASGSVSSGGISYRGEENIWGNMGNWIDGLQSDNPSNWVSNDSSTGVGYGNYMISGKTINIPTAYGSGYVSSFGYDEDFDWVFLPTEILGNSAIPIGDAYWNRHSNVCVPYIGGLNMQMVQVGMFNIGFNFYINSHTPYLGARLIYIPRPEEVTAND